MSSRKSPELIYSKGYREISNLAKTYKHFLSLQYSWAPSIISCFKDDKFNPRSGELVLKEGANIFSIFTGQAKRMTTKDHESWMKKKKKKKYTSNDRRLAKVA